MKFKTRPIIRTKTVYHYASTAPESPSRAPTSDEDLSGFDSNTDSDSHSDSFENHAPQLPLFQHPNVTPQKPSTEEKNHRTYQHESSNQEKKLRVRQKSLEKMQSPQKPINGNKNRPNETKLIIFVFVKYFLLYLSVIVLSAQMHERAPLWTKWAEEIVHREKTCVADKNYSYLDCSLSGDFFLYSLLAKIILWMAKKNLWKTRLFLFGFDSVNKLWTVVYETLVSAICSGMCYFFISRGLNPNTRTNFIRRYWKDAMFGILASFHAAFMKAVLKNLIPKEVFELRITQIFTSVWGNENQNEL